MHVTTYSGTCDLFCLWTLRDFYRHACGLYSRLYCNVSIRISGGGGRVCSDAGPGRSDPSHLSHEAKSPYRGVGGDFACEPSGSGRGGAVGFQERPDRIKHTKFSVRVDWGRSFLLLRSSEVSFAEIAAYPTSK